MKPKLGIIVPLIAPEVVRDRGYVEACLNRTIRSVLKNDSVDLRVYVICQSEPGNMIHDERVCHVKSENPIPQGKTAQGADKAVKLAEGMRAAKEFDPEYVMMVDADDLVSRTIFDYVVEEPGYDAYCVECGYEWVEGSGKMTRCYHFHRLCGTSFILRYSADLFPAWLGGQSEELVCEQSHTCRKEVLIENDFKVYSIEKPCVVYVAGGQDQLMNRSKRFRRKIKDIVLSLWRDRKVSDQLRDEFSI